MRDENHLNELLAGLQGAIKRLRSDHSPEYAADVDEAATQLRVLFDDVEDLAAQLAETTERLRRVEEDRDYMREEFYIMQDRFEDERAEADRLRDEANEAQLRLDEALERESDLRKDLADMSADLRETENRAAWGE